MNLVEIGSKLNEVPSLNQVKSEIQKALDKAFSDLQYTSKNEFKNKTEDLAE